MTREMHADTHRHRHTHTHTHMCTHSHKTQAHIDTTHKITVTFGCNINQTVVLTKAICGPKTVAGYILFVALFSAKNNYTVTHHEVTIF